MIPLIGGILGLGGSIYQSYNEAEMAKIQGAYQKQQYEQNAILAEIAGRQEIRRGDQEAAALGRKGNQIIGAQRASLAAQGIDVNANDALTVQAETAEAIARDKSQIKANAFRQAWGYKMQALNLNFNGQFSSLASENKANSTILAGYLNGGSSFLSGMSKSSYFQGSSASAPATSGNPFLASDGSFKGKGPQMSYQN